MPLHTALVVPRVPRLPRVPRGTAQASQPTLFVPLIDARRQLSDATGEAVADDDVEVLIVPPGVVVLPSASTPTEVCHPQDRRWYRGATVAWANQLGRSWRPVVRYAVGTVQWERIVAAGWWRPVREDSVPDDQRLREPVRVPAPRGRQPRAPGRSAPQPSSRSRSISGPR
jgi:hypothetical protein